MCRSLFWGSVLYHGALTSPHFLVPSACQPYLIGEKAWSCICCSVSLQADLYTVPANRIQTHSLCQLPYRNTIQVVVSQVHCNQFTNLFIPWEMECSLLWYIKGNELYTLFQTCNTALFLFLSIINMLFAVCVYSSPCNLLSCSFLSAALRFILASNWELLSCNQCIVLHKFVSLKKNKKYKNKKQETKRTNSKWKCQKQAATYDAYRTVNQLTARRAHDWIGIFKGPAGFRYEISDMFPLSPSGSLHW